ncbi:MAG: universal stress protein [Chloroflexota bacterium]|nr:universal stress protein [Chloroflexota bacterium]
MTQEYPLLNSAVADPQSGKQQGQVRVLVALGINPYSARLLQTAARLAGSLNGELLALHIAPPGNATSLYAANLQRHVDLAHELGAQVETVEGKDIAVALVNHAQRRRVTHLVLGQSDVSRWREVTRGTVINRIQRLVLQSGGGIDLYIVTASSRF